MSRLAVMYSSCPQASTLLCVKTLWNAEERKMSLGNISSLQEFQKANHTCDMPPSSSEPGN